MYDFNLKDFLILYSAKPYPKSNIFLILGLGIPPTSLSIAPRPATDYPVASVRNKGPLL